MRSNRSLAAALPLALAIGTGPADTSQALGALAQVDLIRDGTALRGVRSVTVSPDGSHIYSVGAQGDGLVVFARDAVTGLLSFVEAWVDDQDGVSSLDGASGVVVSPEGTHVYAASVRDHAVAAFERNPSTGKLISLGSYVDGGGGVEGLAGASSLVLAPSGRHVYVTGQFDDALAVFARDESNGNLTFVEAHFDGAEGVDGLDGASAVAVTPDGNHVYVAAEADHAIAVFSRDAEAGTLVAVETQIDGIGGVQGLHMARAVAVSPDGSHVYVGGAGDFAIAVFSRDAGTGGLAFVEAVIDGVAGAEGLRGVSDIQISADGSSLYSTSELDDSVSVFDRDVVTGVLAFREVHTNGTAGVESLGQAAAVAVSPDGSHVYVGSALDDGVAVFSRDAAGALVFTNAFFDIGLDGASALAMSSDGQHIYTAAPGDDAVVVFSRDAASGRLAIESSVRDGGSGVNGLDHAWALALSADDASLYSVAIEEDAIATFLRDPATGQLTFVDAHFDGLGGTDGLSRPSSVVVSPDGAHVYATGSGEDAIAVFARNAATGVLTFADVIRNGTSGVVGLDRPWSLAVSPDGAHVYATATADDAVTVFSRDSVTGELSFVAASFDGIGGVDGIDRPWAVAVSPDGAHVYVAGRDDDALAVFARDPASGVLAFVEAEFDGVNGVYGLDGVGDVAVAADGAHVAAVGFEGSAFALFARDAGTGELTFVEAAVNGVGDVEGLAGALGVAMSPDSTHVYVASLVDSAIAVFGTPACGNGFTEAAEECDDGGVSPGDGCSSDCIVEVGWVCTGEPAVCTVNCGDGLILGAEQCDDGGVSAGDGCSPTCTIESGWSCVGEPSMCTEDPIAVSTTEDESNSDGDCSLREAVEAANTDTAVDACLAGSGADTISVPAGVYSLAIGSLDVSTELTLQGAGAGSCGAPGVTCIRGSSLHQVLRFVDPGGPYPANVADVTIQQGVGSTGGGILNLGADLVVEDSLVRNNTAFTSGGGIHNDGPSLTVRRSTFLSNQADQGGAIWNSDQIVQVEDSTIASNSADHGGGAYNSSGSFTLTRTTVTNNDATVGDGGGVWNQGTLTLTSSSVDSNDAAGQGGGIWSNATLYVDASTISNNTAIVTGGISNEVSGTATVGNSTVSGNSATTTGGIGNGGTFTLTHATVVGNTAGGGGDGIGSAGTVNRQGTILANNGSQNCFCFGCTDNELGGNRVDDASCDGVANMSAVDDTDIDHDLADNGGPTLTHKLPGGSVAIDAAGACGLAVDQRGLVRPQGAGCDSGAVELDSGCGDGLANPALGEACDDGNLVDGDGCDSNCTVTACGNGIVTTGEACDDGNAIDGDGCDSNCTATSCGNGILTTGEQCDDGNTADGDCCSATCQFQPALGVGGTPNCCSAGVCQTGVGCGAICFTPGAICKQPGGAGTACTCELP